MHTDADTPAAAPSPPPPPPPPRRGRGPWARAGRWALGVVAALVLLLGGVLWWAWHSEGGTTQLLARVPGLTTHGQHGRLTGGAFALDHLVWQSGTLRVEVQSLSWRDAHWQPRPYPGAWIGLRLQAPRAERIVITTLPPAQPKPKAQPPQNLKLPLELLAPDFRVAQLQVGSGAPITDLRADLHLGAQQGAQHTLSHLALLRTGTAVRGDLTVGSAAPMPVHGALGAAVSPDAAQPWQAGVRLSGTLPALALDARVSVGRPAPGQPAATAVAQAIVTPFAAWPLGELQAQWQGVDLAALAPSLPHTLLSGSARTTSTTGASGPPHMPPLQLALANAEPGPWNAARLPIASLQAVLHATAANDALSLDGLAVQLAAPHAAGRLSGQARWTAQQLQLQARVDDVTPALLLGRGPAMPIDGDLRLAIQGLALPGQPPAGGAQGGDLRGQVQARLEGRPVLQHRRAQPSSLPRVQLQADGSFTQRRNGELELALQRAEASSPGGRAQASAQARRDTTGGWHVSSRGEMAGFDPGVWWPQAAGGHADGAINAHWQTQLEWPAAAAPSLLAALRGQGELVIAPSRFAGVPLHGQAHLLARVQGTDVDAELHAAQNDLQLHGRVAGAAPQWTVDLRAPALGALSPLHALLPGLARWFPTAGALMAQASVSGQGTDTRTRGHVHAEGLRSPALTLARADATWRIDGTAPSDPLQLQLDAAALTLGAQRLDRLQARLQGSPASHTLQVDAASPLQPPAWVMASRQVNTPGQRLPSASTGSELHLALQGHWQDAPGAARGAGSAGHGGRWHGTLQTLRALPRGGGAPWLSAQAIDASLQLGASGQPQQLQLAPGRIALFGGAVRWQQASWQAAPSPAQRPRIALDAQVEPLQVAPLLAHLQPQFGWQGDLTLAGHLRLHSGPTLDADLAIERQRGDLAMQFQGVKRPLGLSALRVALAAQQGRWRLAENVAGRNLGLLQGEQRTEAAANGLLPATGAPLSGGVNLKVPDLAVWTPWLPAGWQASGQLQAQAALGGRIGAPSLSGRINGQRLAVDDLFEGVHLRDGTLAVALQGDRATIERFVFHSEGQGLLQVSGGAVFGASPQAQLRVATQRFRALDRIDRRIAITGRADANLQAKQVTVRGAFRIDDGLVDVSQADAPKLGNDVVVLHAPASPPGAKAGSANASGTASARGSSTGSDAAPPRSALPAADVNLAIDLGDQLRLHGRGIDTRLRGQLRVTTPGGQLAVNGVVRADGGTYTAYSQNLLIERGTLTFSGEVANPTLDVLAVRPDLDIRVGVQVTGHASDPRVRLYSAPAMPEMDTLTWLVLGRAPEGLGRDDTALLQRAALALFAGDKGSTNKSFIKQLGLDELSVHRATGNGSDDAAGTIVSLGKQVSKRLFVGYERALAAAGGTWDLIYRVFGRLTVRARTGDEDSVDAVWTWRWD